MEELQGISRTLRIRKIFMLSYHLRRWGRENFVSAALQAAQLFKDGDSDGS